MQIIYERLLSRIQKEFLQLSNKKTTHKKWAKDPSRQFSRDAVQMTHKHVKICSTSFAIREIPIKTTRHHFTPTGTAIIRKTDKTSRKWRNWRNWNLQIWLMGQ